MKKGNLTLIFTLNEQMAQAAEFHYNCIHQNCLSHRS